MAMIPISDDPKRVIFFGGSNSMENSVWHYDIEAGQFMRAINDADPSCENVDGGVGCSGYRPENMPTYRVGAIGGAMGEKEVVVFGGFEHGFVYDADVWSYQYRNVEAECNQNAQFEESTLDCICNSGFIGDGIECLNPADDDSDGEGNDDARGGVYVRTLLLIGLLIGVPPIVACAVLGVALVVVIVVAVKKRNASSLDFDFGDDEFDEMDGFEKDRKSKREEERKLKERKRKEKEEKRRRAEAERKRRKEEAERKRKEKEASEKVTNSNETEEEKKRKEEAERMMKEKKEEERRKAKREEKQKRKEEMRKLKREGAKKRRELKEAQKQKEEEESERKRKEDEEAKQKKKEEEERKRKEEEEKRRKKEKMKKEQELLEEEERKKAAAAELEKSRRREEEEEEDKLFIFLKNAKLEKYYKGFKSEEIEYLDLAKGLLVKTDIEGIISKELHQKRLFKCIEELSSSATIKQQQQQQQKGVIKTLFIKYNSNVTNLEDIPLNISNDRLINMIISEFEIEDASVTDFELAFKDKKFISASNPGFTVAKLVECTGMSIVAVRTVLKRVLEY